MNRSQGSISLLIINFLKHAKKDNDITTLCKAEVADLLKSEFGDTMEDPTDPAKVEELFKMLDHDRGGRVDITEYLTIVGALIIACKGYMKNT